MRRNDDPLALFILSGLGLMFVLCNLSSGLLLTMSVLFDPLGCDIAATLMFWVSIGCLFTAALILNRPSTTDEVCAYVATRLIERASNSV